MAPYPFDSTVAFGWIAIFMFIGVGLRFLVPFFGRNSIPSCMSGGLIGLVLINLGVFNGLGTFKPNAEMMQLIVFHLYGLSFVCFGLMGFGSGKKALKTIASGIFLSQATALAAVIYSVTVGGIIFLWNHFFGTAFLESIGYIMSMGFVGGPGPAMGTGAVWERAGHTGLINIALAYGAFGFIASVIFGVPLASYIKRLYKCSAIVDEATGGGTHEADPAMVQENVECFEESLQGVYPPGQAPSAGLQTFISSNLDTMSFHGIIVFSTYMFSFALMSLLEVILPGTWPHIIWAQFAPFVCMPCAIFVKELLINRGFKLSDYFDLGCIRRITGFIIDFMATGALISVQINAIGSFLPVLIITSIIAPTLVVIALFFFFRYTKENAGERLVGVVGCATGTVTTGLVLIRILDPEYKTTASLELGLVGLGGLLVMPLSMLWMPWVFSQALTNGPAWQFFAAQGCGLLLFFAIIVIFFRKWFDFKAGPKY